MRGERSLVADASGGRLSRSPGNTEEHLCFLLGRESYAVAIGAVREIVKPSPISEVPRAGNAILGVMSVRGTIVTVIDLSAYVGEGRITLGKHARILLTESETGEVVGLAVSQVLGVQRLSLDDIEPAYATLGEGSPHVQAVARPDGGPMIVLLDVVSLLGTL